MTLRARAFIVSDMNSETHRFDGPLVDRDQLGRLFRAARIVAGFDRVDDAAAEIRSRTGVAISARTLYALERGEQSVTLEHLVAAAFTFRPPTGVGFFRDSVREDVRLYLDQNERDIRGRS